MSRIAESELIINGDGSVFHLHIRPDELADTVLLVGDPDRVTVIGEHLDSREFSRQSREFRTITGLYHGRRISVISTGIGCDNIDIVMTEIDALANVDFTTREIKNEKKHLRILRLGTCGAIQKEIPLGSYIFSEISAGFDGLMNWYGNREEIALKEMEEAFLKHMENWDTHLPVPYFVKDSAKLAELFSDTTIKGITISAPGFYGPQGRVIRMPLIMPDMMEKVEKFCYKRLKITNFEMEGSAIAGFSAHLGHDAGTICLVIANRHNHNSDPDYKRLMDDLITMVLNKLSK